jgi:hypothetical protein
VNLVSRPVAAQVGLVDPSSARLAGERGPVVRAPAAAG